MRKIASFGAFCALSFFVNSVTLSAQTPLALGPFESAFMHGGLKLGYTTKILIENLVLNNAAHVSARVILDISIIEANFRNIILSQVPSEKLKIGTENFSIMIDPKAISLTAIGNKPYIVSEISLNQAKFLGKDVNDVFDKAIIVKTPLLFAFSKNAGATISTGKPVVTLHGNFKEVVEKIDSIPFVNISEMIVEEVAKAVYFKRSFPVPAIDPYKIKLASYKACRLDNRFIMDFSGSGIVGSGALTPLLQNAFFSAPDNKSLVKVSIPK